MIALTGPEEEELREYLAHLDLKPPLVGLLRECVRQFLHERSTEPYTKFIGVRPEWAEQYRRRHPPFVIVR